MGSLVALDQAALIAAEGNEEHQFLTFRLGEESFAIRILNVREIIEYTAPTVVPLMPPFLRGVINLRGKVVPVIDLAQRFDREATALGRRTCIIIVEVQGEDGHQDLGVIVDAVSQVVEIPPADIEPAPSFGTRLRAEFIAGIGKVEGQFVIVLDIERALSVTEISALATAGASAGTGGGVGAALAPPANTGAPS
jgi:purine-binding chemotaxis protein CheW